MNTELLVYQKQKQVFCEYPCILNNHYFIKEGHYTAKHNKNMLNTLLQIKFCFFVCNFIVL